MQSDLNSISKQKGVAALVVTLLITLIATVATVYASRGSTLTQQSSSNHYQNTAAQQAAEVGLNEFIQQINSDLILLSDATASNDGDTVILAKGIPSGATCYSKLGKINYIIKDAYKGADNTRFKFDSSNPDDTTKNRFFTAEISQLGDSILGVNQKAAYRVQAMFNGSQLDIVSEGCIDNNKTTPTASDYACQSSNALSKVRNSVNLAGGLSIGGSALTVRKYFDSTGSFTVDNIGGAPECSVLTGETYEMTYGTQQLWGIPKEQNAGLAALEPNAYFKQIFAGSSKAEMKQAAQKDTGLVLNANTCPTPAQLVGKKIVWFEGGLNSSAFNVLVDSDSGKPTCDLTTQNLTVIVNGDINASAAIKVNGMLYAGGNVKQDGSFKVQGAAAIEGFWDIGAPGDTYYNNFSGKNEINTKNDAANAGTAQAAGKGSIHITYNKDILNPPIPPSATARSSSWIDF